MNNIEKDQSVKNIHRRVIGNQINLFTAVSLNATAPMLNKISSKRPTSNFNALYTPAMRIKSGTKLNVMASGKDISRELSSIANITTKKYANRLNLHGKNIDK